MIFSHATEISTNFRLFWNLRWLLRYINDMYEPNYLHKFFSAVHFASLGWVLVHLGPNPVVLGSNSVVLRPNLVVLGPNPVDKGPNPVDLGPN